MFLTFCILCGTDYLERIPKIGPKTAHALVAKLDGSIPSIFTPMGWTDIPEAIARSVNVSHNYVSQFKFTWLLFQFALVRNPRSGVVEHLRQPSSADKLLEEYRLLFPDNRKRRRPN